MTTDRFMEAYECGMKWLRWERYSMVGLMLAAVVLPFDAALALGCLLAAALWCGICFVVSARLIAECEEINCSLGVTDYRGKEQ